MPGNLLNVNTFERFKAAQEKASQHLQQVYESAAQCRLSLTCSKLPFGMLHRRARRRSDARHIWLLFT